MSEKDDRLYLVHILERIERIEQYTGGKREPFLQSDMVQDAVLRNLHTMAESTQRLSDAAKAAHPEVDWQTLSRFRNVLVHNYLGTNMNRIADIIELHLPVLKQAVAAMFEEASEAAPPTS